ncbi:hypothetical protein [Nostoc sp. 'Peltigera membranacea cyanobiont' N6]|uniref:hypothetical protein n=1 Tax=Nostoc sp. 'Peltigera membranacea cyanobiont' N6 TaxID=1261031 RepID=UPI000CF35C7B|nr:hypothetical protein [Nostoc sp. 'Peltigera membranacea cyanobiont' N6]AVH66343.1 hypothetical protein NPM_4872 [Nostoc sp. 'Peltigera membranacea cyanobiont' N6]MBD2513389.1 hypothetical protein [Desmonostoc muscorum FACHB-395]
MTFDPRTIGEPVYEALQNLRTDNENNKERLKEQKNQAVELYTYLSTWGMLRLKAEEKALTQEGKKQVVKKYFECLERLSSLENLASDNGLQVLKQANITTEAYLGLTGLGLALAQEFSFWASAVYWDIKGE